MHKRKLGGEGLEVSAIGLGCLSSPTSGSRVKEALTVSIIRRALDNGVTFFDTAEAYGPWENEKQVGKALRGVRDPGDEAYPALVHDAMVVALSGRIHLDEAADTTPEQVLKEIWEDRFLLRPPAAAPG